MPLNMHLTINLHNILVTLRHLLNAAFITSLLHLLIFSRVSYTDRNSNRRLKIIFVFAICLILYAAAMGRIGNQMRSYEKSRKAWEKAKKETEMAKEAWREEKCAALAAKARAEAAERDANDAEARSRAAEWDADEAITRLQRERENPEYQRLVDEHEQLGADLAHVLGLYDAQVQAISAQAGNGN